MKFYIEIDALDALVSSLKKASPSISSIAIITDTTVEKLYGQSVLEKLENADFAVGIFSFEAGEASKIRKTKEQIEDALIAAGFDKASAIIALGGGVVLDLAGFIAATYMRGVRLYSVPTTLLSMVDACYGGKNGVNTDQAKNMIGSIHFPQGIFIDPSLLKTLNETERLSGMAEVVKHALIQDKEFAQTLFNFDFKDNAAIKDLIQKNLKIKAHIVDASIQEKASQMRDQLNFGHTLGHAIEALFKYEISHGYGVFVGMAFANFLSLKLGHMPEKEFEEMDRLIHHIFVSLPAFMILIKETLESKENLDFVIELMLRDKKNEGNQIRFVLLEGVGKVHTQLEYDVSDEGLDLKEKQKICFTHAVDQNVVKSSLNEFFMRYAGYENASVR